MKSTQSIVRVNGILLVLLFSISSIAAALAGSVGDYNIAAEEIGSLLERIAEHKELHMAEIGFDFFSYIITVILATTMFFTFSVYDRLWALLGMVGIICGAVILAAHDIPHFVLPWIADTFVAAVGDDSMSLKYMANIVLMSAMWGLSVGVSFLGLGFMAYAVLLIKSRPVPLIFGWLGAVSGVLLSVGVWLPRYDEAFYSLFVILASPLGLWQLAFGIWLIAKGVREHDA